jgi:hypothetical protein
MEIVAVGQDLLGLLMFSPVRIIPSVLHNHISFIWYQRYVILVADSVV